jgi:hypothetical protein
LEVPEKRRLSQLYWVSDGYLLIYIVLYGGTSILHTLIGHGDMEGSGYAAQIHHAAGNSADSCTPGAAFLFLAVRQRQSEPCACASDYLISYNYSFRSGDRNHCRKDLSMTIDTFPAGLQVRAPERQELEAVTALIVA